MTDDVREKQVFVAKLKGDPIGEDAFGNAIFLDDIIAYATTHGTSATLKFGKITKLLEKEHLRRDRSGQVVRNRFVKVQVRTVSQWYKDWKVGGLGMPNTANALLIKEPPQEIIDLLEQFENEKGDKS